MRSGLERRLYPLRHKLLFMMLGSMTINAFTLTGDKEVLIASLLGQSLFGQAFFSYLSGWRISIGLGFVGETNVKYGRDLMGGFVLIGFVLMFFFRGY